MQYCTLEKESFLGTFYESETPSEKAVILVGGSGEGRRMVEKRAQTLSQAGFHVLALGYYLWKPLSPHTLRIPVDYAERAVKFLQPYARKIGMTGLSLGAAYTLLCASLIPEISCVVAVSGFDFVVEGCKYALFRQHQSYYSWHGQDVPYEPADALSHLFRTLRTWKRDPRYGAKAMNRFYYGECFPNRTDKSRIKVENIRGDVLLIGPKYDDTWPSDEANIRMAQRLTEVNHPYRHAFVMYEKGSHCLGMLPDTLCADGKSPEATKRLLAKMMTMEAKYPEECSRARADSWAKLVDFFQTW